MADRTSTVRVNVDSDTTGASSKLGGFIGMAGKAALGVAALGAGLAIGANKLYGFADAGDDLNASIAQGIKTMGLYGSGFQEVADRVTDHAKALSQATAVDINSIKTTQAKLLTFKELAKSADTMGGSFDRATLAAVDMAAKGFGSAETNATQLGKALNDPIKGITALTKSGITFTEAEKAKIAALVESGRTMDAQTLILSAIEKQVGGTAAATAGGFELMKNRVSIFAQELAGKALPYMDRFGNFMVETGGPALIRFGNTLSEKVLPVLRSFGNFVGNRVVPVLQDLGGWILDHVVPAFQTVLSGALEGAQGLFKNVASAVDDNRSELGDLGDAAKKVGEFFVDKVIPIMGDFYKNVLPAVGEAIGVAIGIISGIVQTFQNVYDKVEAVVGAVQRLIEWLGKIDVPDINIPGARTTNAVAGTGTVRGDLFARGSSTGSVNITIHVPGGFIGDEITLIRKLRDGLQDDLRRLGVAV
jgi:hypothetical protein